MKTKGLKPKNRSVAKGNGKLFANQWQNTPQQTEFMSYWLDLDSETFGNAYQSALRAGYSNQYANQLASPSINNKWIQEYTNRLNLTDEHIRQGIQQLALKAQDSRSPDDTKLKAYELLAKISGLVDNKQGNTTNVLIQPILAGKSTPDVVSEQ